MIARLCRSATATPYLLCAAKARLKVLTVCSIVLVVALGPATLTAQAADDSIVVGAISSLTGPATFPEASAAAKAVFDRENGRGGINGKKVDYIVEDDRVDPAAATQAARRLVDDRNVVALVGSASLLECSVNAAYYAQKGVASVQGIGIDPVCFHASNIAPAERVNRFETTGRLRGLRWFWSVDIGDRRDDRWFRPATNEALRVLVPCLQENGTSCIAPLIDTAEMHVLGR